MLFPSSRKQEASPYAEYRTRASGTVFDLNQTVLFERLEQQLGSLSEKARLLVSVLGRPSKDRQALATAFLAKAVLGLKTTRQLLERLHADPQLRCLCGWNEVKHIPHEATFSRAFAEFSQTELPQRLHQALIADTQRGRLIGHIARDSTAIEARERYPENPPAQPARKRYKKGPKPKRSTPRAPRSRIEEQRRLPVREMLSELPRHCSLGVKKSSKDTSATGAVISCTSMWPTDRSRLRRCSPEPACTTRKRPSH